MLGRPFTRIVSVNSVAFALAQHPPRSHKTSPEEALHEKTETALVSRLKDYTSRFIALHIACSPHLHFAGYSLRGHHTIHPQRHQSCSFLFHQGEIHYWIFQHINPLLPPLLHPFYNILILIQHLHTPSTSSTIRVHHQYIAQASPISHKHHPPHPKKHSSTHFSSIPRPAYQLVSLLLPHLQHLNLPSTLQAPLTALSILHHDFPFSIYQYP